MRDFTFDSLTWCSRDDIKCELSRVGGGGHSESQLYVSHREECHPLES